MGILPMSNVCGTHTGAYAPPVLLFRAYLDDLVRDELDEAVGLVLDGPHASGFGTCPKSHGWQLPTGYDGLDGPCGHGLGLAGLRGHAGDAHASAVTVGVRDVLGYRPLRKAAEELVAAGQR